MKLVLLLTVLLVVAGGCMKQSEKYCAMHPEDTVNCGGDGGAGCLDNSDCVAIDPDRPVCSEESRCVECTIDDAAQCTGGLVCNSDHTCGACTDHAECASSVCRADGRCADTADVAYAAAGGSGTQCTRDMPCGDLARARDTMRPIIKVSGALRNMDIVRFAARSTEIYGDSGASVTRMQLGPILEVAGDGTELSIYGLRITGAEGAASSGHGIVMAGNPSLAKLTLDRVIIDENEGSAVRAADGGDVTITRSVIANNTGNHGLYLANGSFSITNTIIVANGRISAANGAGVYVAPMTASRFEFNTVANNVSTLVNGNYRGVTCGTPGFAISNNIITDNDTSQCDVTYSFFTPGDEPPSGTGNLSGDPMFKSTAMPASPTFYRLTPSSPAKDKADPAATLSDDIDGNTRPVDGRSDMGADEVIP